MKSATQTFLAVTATVVVASATIVAGALTESTGNPAFDVGHTAGRTEPPATAPRPAPHLAPQASQALDPAFGTRPGDCPTEDSCRPEYDGKTDSWSIVPIVP